MPASRMPRSSTIHVRVPIARFTVGRANAPTPLLTASTPVIAVQPLANALISSQRVAGATAAGSGGGGGTGAGGLPACQNRLHDPDQNRGAQRPDEHVGWQCEGEPGFLDSAQVDDGHEGEDAQGDRKSVVEGKSVD